MIVRLYRSGYVINIVLFVLISLLLWLGVFLSPVTTIPKIGSGFLDYLVPTSEQVSPYLLSIGAFLLVVAEALLLNSIVNGIPVFSRASFFVALIFMILISYQPAMQTFHPILVANLFIILSLRNLVKCYSKEPTYRETFNASFWVAIASLFYLPLALMLVFIWAAFIIYRISSWREWFITVIGFITPMLFLLSMLFITNRLNDFGAFVSDQVASTGRLKFSIVPKSLFFWISFSVVVLVSFLKIVFDTGEKLITIRKTFNVFLAGFLSTAVIVTIGFANDTSLYHLLFPWASLMFSNYFLQAKNMFFSEVLFTLLIVGMLIMRFV